MKKADKVVRFSKVQELKQEQAKLRARQAEIAALLEDTETPLETIKALSQERAVNVDVLHALAPRIEQAQRAAKAARIAERDAAADALRPKERAAHADVVKAAESLHAAIEAYHQVAGELHAAGASPRSTIPPALCNLVKPGVSGGLHWWAESGRGYTA